VDLLDAISESNRRLKLIFVSEDAAFFAEYNDVKISFLKILDLLGITFSRQI
jgi:hypothetical protein